MGRFGTGRCTAGMAAESLSELQELLASLAEGLLVDEPELALLLVVQH